MSGPYAAVGEKLVERGYAAIPVMPGTKRPGHMRGGKWIGMNDWHEKYSRRPPSQFEIDIWSRTEAGVCIVCGRGSKDLIGIDIDTDHPDLVAAFNELLPATPLRKRGENGETRLYRGRPVTRSFNLTDPKYKPEKVAEGKQYRVCDIIGEGRQTVLPPTVHPVTNEPYKWIGGAALEDYDYDDIPLIDDDIADQIAKMLELFGFKEEPKNSLTRDPADGETPHRALNEFALANLESWVPRLGLYGWRRRHQGYEAVPTWRASNRGTPNEKRKLNLKISPDGINDFGDGPKGYTPIDLVMVSQGCDLDTAFRWLAEITGWNSTTITIGLKPKGNAEEKNEEPEPVPASAIDPDMPAVLMESDDPFLHLTHVPGVVGDLIEWMTNSAMFPSRVLNLITALEVVGTLIGRRAATPTDSATHLYCVGLAPTGSGKQHPISCARRAMAAAKASHHVGPPEFVSTRAFIDHIFKKPLSICMQDEYGAFLKRVNSKNASSHEVGISKMMREAWGLSFDEYSSPASAAHASVTIRSPAFSMLGMSTHEEFYDSLHGADIVNGFLNRFLIVSTDDWVDEVEPALDRRKVPSKLTDDLHELYLWGGNLLGTARLNDAILDAHPTRLGWSKSAETLYRNFTKHVRSIMGSTPEKASFYARTAEIGLRLSTIRAAGRLGHSASIDANDMQWGADLAMASADLMAGDALKRMAVEMTQGKIANRILELLSKRGRTKRRDLLRAMGNGVKVRDFDEASKMLIESGQVEMEKSRPAAGGPETLWLDIAA